MNTAYFINFVSILLFFKRGVYSEANSDDTNHLKCLVCQRVVEEMEKEIDSISPNKKISVGSYRLDDKSDPVQIEYRRSEVYLTELMDTVCNKMDDYARAVYKTNGQLTVIPLIKDDKVNPVLDEVNLVTDADLNKSLKHFCQQILDEYEDDVVTLFRSSADNIDIRLCSQAAGLCNQSIDEEYVFEDERDEL